MTLEQQRQLNPVDPPAPVTNCSVKRRFTDKISAKTNLSGIESFFHSDGAAFKAFQDGLKPQMLIKNSPTTLMNHPNRRTDFSIRMGPDVLAQKVDQARLLLEEPEQLQRRADIGGGRQRGGQLGTLGRRKARPGGFLESAPATADSQKRKQGQNHSQQKKDQHQSAKDQMKKIQCQRDLAAINGHE